MIFPYSLNSICFIVTYSIYKIAPRGLLVWTLSLFPSLSSSSSIISLFEYRSLLCLVSVFIVSWITWMHHIPWLHLFHCIHWWCIKWSSRSLVFSMRWILRLLTHWMFIWSPSFSCSCCPFRRVLGDPIHVFWWYDDTLESQMNWNLRVRWRGESVHDEWFEREMDWWSDSVVVWTFVEIVNPI